ncbi:MAG: non-heme iron oxygenase ferredoxin subunit [Nitrospinota bacterium]
MADFKTVANVSEIHSGDMKLVDLAGEAVVVANVDGDYFAFGNECTHVGGSLVEGELEGENVTCPLHATVFNIKSGEALEGPGKEPVPTFEVRVEGDDIQIAKS